jgi:hypothetical protein
MNHQGKNAVLEIDAACAQLVEPLKNALNAAGYWAFQSFDLQSTRAFHDEGCACPHHGTQQCTCEMVVLLVYQPASDPVTVILDGRDHRTCVYITDDPGTSPPSTVIDGIIQAIRATAHPWSQ